MCYKQSVVEISKLLEMYFIVDAIKIEINQKV